MKVAQVLVDNYDQFEESHFWYFVNELGFMFSNNNSKYKHDTFLKYIKDRV